MGHQRRSTTVYALLIVAIGAALMLVAVSGITSTRSTTSDTRKTTVGLRDLVIQLDRFNKRVECVRLLTNDLNDNRWTALAMGLDGLRADDNAKINAAVDELLALSGTAGKASLNDRIAKTCPPPVTSPSIKDSP